LDYPYTKPHSFGLRGGESDFGFSSDNLATSTLKDVHLAPSPEYNFTNVATFGGSMKPISILALVLIVFVWAQQSRPQALAAKVPTDFIVVDSKGKTVGPVVGVGELHSVIVAFSFGESLLPIEVFRTSFFHGPLFFTSSNCTGQPFQDESQSPFPASAVSGPGDTLYAADGPSQNITAASTMFGGGFCSSFPTPLSDAVRVAPVVNLDIFTPPFKVVSRARQ
jgi:hypothetical protein